MTWTHAEYTWSPSEYFSLEEIGEKWSELFIFEVRQLFVVTVVVYKQCIVNGSVRFVFLEQY